MNHINSVTLDFRVSGVVVHVIGGRRERPAGRPGATLSVTLADMLAPATLINQPCELRVVVSNLAGMQGASLFKGRVAGWTKRVAASDAPSGATIDDQMELQCVGKLADRWSLAPSRITSYYDPDRLSAEDLAVDVTSLPVNASGAPITAQMDPVEGLTAHEAIRRAALAMGYTGTVVTADDFPLMRIDFTPRSGYYEPVAGILAPAEPIWADDDVNNVLYVLDPFKALPDGYPIRDKYLSQMHMNLSRPAREIINVAEVVYRNDGAYEVSQGRQLTYQENVQLFDPDDGEETVTTWQVYADSSFIPAKPISRIILEQSVRRRDGDGFVIHQSKLINKYLGNVKTGHVIYIEDAIPTLGLGQTRFEEMVINFERQANGDYIQRSTVTTVRGLCLVYDQDGQELLIPVFDALQNKLIYEGGNFEFVSAEISKTTETNTPTGEGQFDATTKRVDFLTSAVESHTAARTGKPSTYAASQRLGHQARMTVENADSIATYGRRKSVEFDAHDLPYAPAVAAAQKWLARKFLAPLEGNIELPDPDFMIRRGSAIRLHERGGAEVGVFIVVGDALSWGPNQPLSQSVTLQEMLINA